MSQTVALGIDIGTSGVRAVALDENRNEVAIAKAQMDTAKGALNLPSIWLDALQTSLAELTESIDPSSIGAICIDGTSGTVLAIDCENQPVGPALMYDYSVPDPEIPEKISAVAPAESAAHGAASALSRSILLLKRTGVVRIVHQSDWIAEQLTKSPVSSDESNALKTGYDPISRKWPNWLQAAGIDVKYLPEVVPTGTSIGHSESVFGLPKGIPIVAGLTDGCASFIATGASEIGNGVTALGTTMTLKILCDKPVFSPQHGIYSHRIGDFWLAGGASNTGGGALSAHFSDDEIDRLSDLIDTSFPSGLDYYPLAKTGERFPISDPGLEPRITPRPEKTEQFLYGLLEGISRIEKTGYAKLEEFGAPKLNSIRTVGGGAKNKTLSKIRMQHLNVPSSPVQSTEAASGAARIAWKYLESTN